MNLPKIAEHWAWRRVWFVRGVILGAFLVVLLTGA